MLMTSVGESECLPNGIPGGLNRGHWARGSRYTHLGRRNPPDPGLWACRRPQGSPGWDRGLWKPAPSGLRLGVGKPYTSVWVEMGCPGPALAPGLLAVL